jgi:hypothetical protein
MVCKQFFFEKKNQKTFFNLGLGRFHMHGMAQTRCVGYPQYVMAVLDTAIHALSPLRRKAWIAGSSPAMTV